ncbi:hypothetical protein evm_006002 [Chilo suppressalis]|nr:hypothetical protein evm_006002 [Chilo suppressalis]
MGAYDCACSWVALHGSLNLPKVEVNIKPTLRLQRGAPKTLVDFTRNHDYQEIYKEMLRISQDSNDVNGDENSSLRNFVGEDKHVVFKDGNVNRRQGGHLRRSMLGRRRARSQALRREKLNSQSLRSHLQHTRQANDYTRTTFALNS